MLQIGYFHDNSTNHGDGNHLTYVVRGLQPLTHYELVVAVESPGDTSPPSHTSRHILFFLYAIIYYRTKVLLLGETGLHDKLSAHVI